MDEWSTDFRVILKNRVSAGESLLTSLFTFLLITHRSRGRIYELNAKVERAD